MTLQLAHRLADVADAVSLQRFRATDLRVSAKPDGTPVTETDTRVEEALRDLLRGERPGDTVVGEEHGVDGDSSVRWYLDPIDGTKNYARGVPVWATLIAQYDRAQPLCAVISAPALRMRWWAAAGEAAFSSHRGALHVSSRIDLTTAGVSCTDVRDFATRRAGAAWQSLLDRCAYVRAFGDFWSHMLVAEGAIEVGIEPVVHPWDVAAVRCIVEAAGGGFTDFRGEARIDTGTAITSNGALHDDVLRLLR